jgi:CAAX prenyl protease-like protein
MPMLALLGIGLSTSTFARALDPLYALRVAGALACVWWFRHEHGLWTQPIAPSWAAVLSGALTFVVWLALAPPLDAVYNAELARQHAELAPYWRAAWDASRVLGALIAVPLAEELAFRGYLQRRMISADFTEVPQARFEWLSLCTTALAFGVLHGQWLAGTCAGVIFSLVVYRSGRLLDAVVAHATTNGLLAAYVLGSGRWDLW